MDEKEKEELLKEIEKKIEDYTKKIEKNPNNASYYNNRGIAFKNLLIILKYYHSHNFSLNIQCNTEDVRLFR